MENNSKYLIAVSIERVIENIIADTKNQVNKEMSDQIELQCIKLTCFNIEVAIDSIFN